MYALSQIASEAQAGGAFDKVIGMIESLCSFSEIVSLTRGSIQNVSTIIGQFLGNLTCVNSCFVDELRSLLRFPVPLAQYSHCSGA